MQGIQIREEQSRQSRCGFTVIELLICIAIVGLLLSLMSSALQNSREAARRTQCLNNVRQLTLGLQLHLNKLRSFPTNGGPSEDSKIRASDGSMVTIGTYDNNSNEQFWWGVGLPGAKPHDQTGSWAYAILPSIEQPSSYETMEVESAGPLFRCPSRSRTDPTVVTTDEFGDYTTAGRAWAQTDYAGNRYVMLQKPDALRDSAILDGLSQTIALGEKAFDPVVHAATTWHHDEPIFSGGSHGTVRGGVIIEPDAPGISFVNNWGSPHPAGAIFSRFDGSVEMVSSQIDVELIRGLLFPHDSIVP
ncbi:hypothetical protein Pla22_16980 [Rubripirellula amarantea]|uniref:DUF1559 domain-containing protein n=1 Tax=Rubripirellula amarantea TaxID=2527999 RepID=A0A5C5WVP9_9BACT|nr:DUF1559 domain-containing protein [Rubripirellula amarantea]TWT54063.1 hypothetical protein Pla22_16980 [Rubripirellula amarantea]